MKQTNLENYKRLKDQYTSIKEEYMKTIKEKGTQLVKLVFAEFFKENPEIFYVGWTQYTPYFNDGDECVFRTSLEWPAFNYVDECDHPKYCNDSAYYDNFPNRDCEYKEYDSYVKKLTTHLEKYNFNDLETLKEIFEDHSCITVQLMPNGVVEVTSDFYDHE